VVSGQNADDADTLHISATWWIRLSHPCAAVILPYVKLLWPLVIWRCTVWFVMNEIESPLFARWHHPEH